MGDSIQTGKPSRYVTSHADQLSLAIPPWVGTASTREIWGKKQTHTITCSETVVWQCKLVSG